MSDLDHLCADLEYALRSRRFGLSLTVSRAEMDALLEAVTDIPGPEHLRLDEDGRLCWRGAQLVVGALPPAVTQRMAARRAA